MDHNIHGCRFIVLTGGPGAGKTAVMEAARQIFTRHVAILPESASIVYSGGFPRFPNPTSTRAAQRAIVRVQEELERYAVEEGSTSVALCDRGISDGAAYWPEGPESFYDAMGTTEAEVFARYHTVIHLHTPPAELGYNNSNPMRIETPGEAALIDAKIERVWRGHPNRFLVPATESFPEKLAQVEELIRRALEGSDPYLLPIDRLLQYSSQRLQ